MKDARKLDKAKTYALTEQERDEIRKLIRKIAANHEKDKWWKVECSIRTWVNVELNALLSEETFAEEIAEEDEE